MPSISYEQKNPILFLKDNKFSKVVAKGAHIEAEHMGLTLIPSGEKFSGKYAPGVCSRLVDLSRYVFARSL